MTNMADSLCRCMANLNSPALGFLQDHAVQGHPLFPAAAFMEAVAAAAFQLLADESSQMGCLQGMAFLAPLLLSNGTGQRGSKYASHSRNLLTSDYKGENFCSIFRGSFHTFQAAWLDIAIILHVGRACLSQ